jgi:hypothetical protein
LASSTGAGTGVVSGADIVGKTQRSFERTSQKDKDKGEKQGDLKKQKHT